ncbi:MULTISPECIES: hypothetical protein [unclassified Microbacterium]|uniref:hypothetical protein n=1 Tax=unclassified Microbacterium TaxID=2609290 RepID=UPI001604DBB9|nr:MULTISPECIES: hypothetical protein [unclassified Microbacterium]QNA92697.1 hypothetical protein G4G29_10495 [Microbacterium sp. Se63.02b]QYM62831.1 hypothetical protein K1X59_10530 [Microbacterium sp. Se5.02b]
MTKIQKHTIDLRSPRTEALEAAEAELENLTAQTDTLRASALAGNLGAETLAAHTDRLNLATMRVDAARHAAEAELNNLADRNSIADAIAELLDDPALATTPIEDAISKLRQALADITTANETRNSAITGWVTRLRQLGVPDTGLTVNGDEIHISSAGPTGTTITIGGGRVSTIGSVAGHIRHTTQKHSDSAHMAIDPANLPSSDTRGRALGSTTAVRLLKNLGGNKAGTVLTTRTHSLGVLAKFVHDGHAELIDGQIPDESKHTLKRFPVDTRPQEQPERVTPTNVNDATRVEDAVRKAFTN